MPQLLLVEDDAHVIAPVRRYFLRQKFEIDVCETLLGATEYIARRRPSAIILDLLLPDGHGLEFLRQARAAGLSVPVIIVSTLGSWRDQIVGLRAGATDYVPKPIYLPLLVERVRASLRSVTTLNTFAVDVVSRLASNGTTSIRLTATEIVMLQHLSTTRGAVRRQSFLQMWPGESAPRPRTVDYYIHRLRTKLKQIGHGGCIRTTRGGYVLDGQIEWVGSETGTESPAHMWRSSTL